MSSPPASSVELDSLRQENALLRGRVRLLEETSIKFRKHIQDMLQSHERHHDGACEEQRHRSVSNSTQSERDFFASISQSPFPRSSGDDGSVGEALTLHDWIRRNHELVEQLEKTKEKANYWRSRSMEDRALSNSRDRRGGSSVRRSPRAASRSQDRSAHQSTSPRADDDAINATVQRRRYAALVRRLAHMEEAHHAELAAKDDAIADLTVQLSDARTVLVSLEHERNTATTTLLGMQRTEIPKDNLVHSLQGRVATLEAERRLFIRTAEELQLKLTSATTEVENRERSVQSSMREEIRSLKAAVDSLTASSHNWEVQAHALEAEVASLHESIQLVQRQYDEAKKIIDDRVHAEEGSGRESVSAVLRRLTDVVSKAESTAHQSAQGGVALLAKKLTVAETLTKSVQQYADMLSTKERQLNALLAEIESCERVGWPLRTKDARQCLLEVTMESNLQPPPPREIVLRTMEGNWKEVRDVRRNALYYVTTKIDETPFGSKSKH